MNEHTVRLAGNGPTVDFNPEAPPENLGDLFGQPDDPGIAEQARTYLRARQAALDAEAAFEAAKKTRDQAEGALLDALAQAGVLSVRVEDASGKVSLVTSATSTYYSLPAGSLEDTTIYRWLLQSGGHDLVRRTIHHMSVSSFCRELVEAGRPLHPAVKVVEKRLIRVSGR